MLKDKEGIHTLVRTRSEICVFWVVIDRHP